MNDHQLRDVMAAAAMQGMLAYSHVNQSFGNWQENASPRDVARRAYQYADAMVAERRRSIVRLQDLTRADIGRGVVYFDSSGDRRVGKLVSCESDMFIAVMFEGDAQPTSCLIDHCRWDDGGES